MASPAPIRIRFLGVDMVAKHFRKLTKQADTFGKAVGSIGKTMSAAFTAPIIGLGVASGKMAMDFNSAMANVGTMIPGEVKRLEDLKDGVMDLSIAVGQKDFNVMAEGLYETISAFGSAVDPMNKLTTAAKMSKAGMSTVKEALSLVSAVTKGYGDTSDDAAKSVSDMSFLTVKLGQTTFPELAAAIGSVVPLATTLNIKQQELFGGFATLTGVTGNASEVATQFKSALGALVTPTTAMTKAAKKLGYASSVAMVQELGFGKTIEKLGEYTGGSVIKLGELITRKEGLNAVLTLLNPQAKNFVEKTAAMGNAAGATDTALKQQTSGINKTGFALDQMMARMKRLAIIIGDKLSPAIMGIMNRLDPFITKMDSLSENQLILGMKIAGVVAAVGPLLVVFGKLVTVGTAVASAVGSAGGLAGVLAIITGPVGAVIAGVTALVGALIYFREELKPLAMAVIAPLISSFETFKNELFGTDTGMSGLLKSIKPIISFFSRLIAPVVRLGVWMGMLPLKYLSKALRVSADVLSVLASAFTVVTKSVELVFAWIGKLWRRFTEGSEIGKTIGGVFDWIGEKIGSVWDKISGFFDSIKDLTSWAKTSLDSLSGSLDKEIKGQDIMSYNLAIPSGSGAPLTTHDEYINMIAAGKQETKLTVDFTGLPDGAQASVKSVKGGSVEVDDGRGPIMKGEL